MEKIKCLGRYQKGILIFMMIMVMAFAGIYSISIGRAGFAYKDSLLIPQKKNGSTVYSGIIYGKEAVFTVSSDKAVEFQYDGTIYGPYTAKEDSNVLIVKLGNGGTVVLKKVKQ